MTNYGNDRRPYQLTGFEDAFALVRVAFVAAVAIFVSIAFFGG